MFNSASHKRFASTLFLALSLVITQHALATENDAAGTVVTDSGGVLETSRQVLVGTGFVALAEACRLAENAGVDASLIPANANQTRGIESKEGLLGNSHSFQAKTTGRHI